MIQWVDVRCRGCHRLLFKATAGALVGPVQIKCPRCADVNQLGSLGPCSDPDAF